VSAVAKRLREAAEALALAAEALEAETAGRTAGVYDRTSLPPGFRSPEAFAGECRRLGLDRVVYRSGRSWSVPRSAWEEARREDRARRVQSAPSPEVDPIDETLRKAGLRLVRGPR
jgi:hypothetical protein